jgi:beta-glucosidase
MDADEVVQAYIQYPSFERMPLKELKAFKRVYIVKGTEQSIRLSIPVSDLQKWDMNQNKWLLYPGEYTLLIGSNSRDSKLNSAVKIKAGIK